jgi:hypothetical protein
VSLVVKPELDDALETSLETATRVAALKDRYGEPERGGVNGSR